MDHGWTVTAEAAGDAGEITDDVLVAFHDLLTDRGGAVFGGPNKYGATFTISGAEATDPPEVTKWAMAVFETKAHDAGLPSWPIVRLEMMTIAEHDADLERPAFPELVGIKEIAETLGVSPQRAHQLTKRDDFPDPIARLAAGPIWTRPSLERFIDDWRAGKPPEPDEVGILDSLIVELKTARNRIAHGEPFQLSPDELAQMYEWIASVILPLAVPPDRRDELHTTVPEILKRQTRIPG